MPAAPDNRKVSLGPMTPRTDTTMNYLAVALLIVLVVAAILEVAR